MTLLAAKDIMEIEMQTTLEVEDDVLDAARAMAAAEGISLGAALSDLARRGLAARITIGSRNGFPVIQVPAGTPTFGPQDVRDAEEWDDAEAAQRFFGPGS